MNLELYIENLGAIEKAELSINPLTILAGENGTGKSFVTKFLYSVLKVLNQDFYKKELLNQISELLKNINLLKVKGWLSQSIFSSMGMFLVRIQEKAFHSKNLLNENFEDEQKEFNELAEMYSLENSSKMESIRQKLADNADKTNSLQKMIFKKDMSEIIAQANLLEMLEKNVYSMHYFFQLITDKEFYYFKILESEIVSELKANFQVSDLNQLIKNDCEKLLFEIKNILTVDITRNNFGIQQNYYSINNLLGINRLVFFESPVYWRLSPFVLNNTKQSQTFYLSDKIDDEQLTGIPQHFLDLRELVFANFKHGERPAFIEECAKELQNSLNGKFNSNGNDLAFETNQGQAISKNLVSFGMTNLGVLQAVLSKNIINKGSFVFLDEPESNLHPEWQAVLAKILVKLAENGVFVVITTHSSDMLKALDVYNTQQQQDNFISTNYFEKNGNLTVFDKEDIDNVGKLALVRNKLLEPYASLTFAKKGGFFDD